MSTPIQTALAGIERIQSMALDPASHHYITLSLLNQWLTEIALPQASGTMLDFGCGGQPYRELFGTRITKYIGADVAAAQGVSIDLRLTPGARVPMEDATVDTILSTQALEHVYDFQLYIEECKRLLRPGGILILTAPQQWRLHEVPYDYWRFTRHGLEESFRRVDLTVETMTPCGGVYALLGQVLTGHLAERGGGGRKLIRLLNRTALWLDSKTRDYEDPILWMCIARKSSVTGEASGHRANNKIQTASDANNN